MPNVSLLTSGIGDVNQGGSLVPTGTVFAFAGATAPAGWLLCDGTAYNQADYASLFSVIGSIYNTQTNPTTNAAWAAPSAGQFRVPDYRGIFLRSAGQASGQSSVTVGGHQSQATAKNGLNAATSGADGNHSHQMSTAIASSGGEASGYGLTNDYPGFANRALVTSSVQSIIATTTSSANHGHAISITGDSETRPTNKGVLYIIKV